VADIQLSVAARADLVEIRRYSIEQFSAEVADAYYTGFDDAFDLLCRHPLAGTERPELGRGVRCLTHRKHQIFHIVRNDIVFILRIIHHAQDARRALN
jgi:toxin ParE1/3/4